MNKNIAICPECDTVHKISSLSLSDINNKGNIQDVVAQCTTCKHHFLIECEATDGLEAFEFGELLYSTDTMQQAKIIYQQNNLVSSNFNYSKQNLN